MKNVFNSDLIHEITVKTDIALAFIEKDWYAVQLLKALNESKVAPVL